MPASDLTLPATVAAELGGGVSSSDARLPRLISAASGAILRYLGRPQLHYSASFVEKLAGFGTYRLVLGLTPVLEMVSASIGGGAIDASGITIEHAEAGIIARAGGWPWTGSFRQGLPPAMDRDAGSELPIIELTYKGGYVTPAQAAEVGWSGPSRSLPYDLEEACVQTVVSLYRGGGQAGNIAAESLGDYSVSFRQVSEGGVIPEGVLPLLDTYRRLA